MRVGKRIPASAAGEGPNDMQDQGPKRKKTSKMLKLSEILDTVEVFTREKVAAKSLSDLVREYGSELRIVLDPSIARFKITGSTDEKLVPTTVWGALQLVARHREKAVSSLDIGKILGFDQKTVFYFIKTMINLGLVAKFQSFDSNTSANFVLHRRYWHQNPTWVANQQTQMANMRLQQSTSMQQSTRIESGSASQQQTSTDHADDENDGANVAGHVETTDVSAFLSVTSATDVPRIDSDRAFAPWSDSAVDVRPTRYQHTQTSQPPVSLNLERVASFPVISRARSLAIINHPMLLQHRLLALMLTSDGTWIPASELWSRLGFGSELGGQQYLSATLQQLIDANNVKQASWEVTHSGHPMELLVYGLTESGGTLARSLNDLQSATPTDEANLEALAERQIVLTQHSLKGQVVFERDLLEVIRASGSSGLTIGEMVAYFRASFYARRHFEEAIHALEVSPLEAGFPDLAIGTIMEKFGRERRLRVRAAKGFLDWSEADGNIEYGPRHSQMCHLDPEPFIGFTLLPSELGTTVSDREIKAKASSSSKATKNTAKESPLPKLSKVRKQPDPKKYTNPVDPDTGRPRKGRPRKSDIASHQVRKRKGKDALIELDDSTLDTNNGRDSLDDVSGSKRRRTIEPGSFPSPVTTAPTVQDVRSEQAIQSDEGSVSRPIEAPNALGCSAQSSDQVASGTSLEVLQPVATNDDRSLPAENIESLATPGRLHVGDDTASLGDNVTPSTVAPKEEESAKKLVYGSSKGPRQSRQRVDVAAEHRARLVLYLLERHGGIVEDAVMGNLALDVLQSSESVEQGFSKEIGDLTDSKTRQRVLHVLKQRGEIKTTQTQAMTVTKGQGKVARKIVYLASVQDEDLIAFVNQVQQGLRPSTTQRNKEQAARRAGFSRASIDAEQVVEATEVERTLYFGDLQALLDDDGTRYLFNDLPNVRSQPYGYIVAPIARLMTLHLQIFRLLSSGVNDSGGIISSSSAVIDMAKFADSLSLEHLLKLKAIERPVPALDDAYSDSTAKAMPLAQQDEAVRHAFDADFLQSHGEWILSDYMEDLTALGLAVPVQAIKGDALRGFIKVEFDNGQRLFQFTHAALKDGVFSHAGEEGSGPMLTEEDAHNYWSALRANREDQSARMAQFVAAGDAGWKENALRRLYPLLRNGKKWSPSPTLCKRQMRFINRFHSWPPGRPEGSAAYDDQLLVRIAKCALVRPEIVAGFMKRTLAPHLRDKFEPHRAARSTRARNERPQKRKSQREVALTEVVKRTPGRPRKKREAPEDDASKATRRRRVQWTRFIEETCEELQLPLNRQAKLEAVLAPMRDELLSDESLLSPDMLREMIIKTYTGEYKAEEYSEPPPGKDAKKKKRKKGADETAVDADSLVFEENAVRPKGTRARRKKDTDLWNRESDELLRDACVILTARDRARFHGRSNWMALQQIFPNIPTPRLRARYLLLASAVGEEAYLGQLEKEWTALWEIWRGTALLPDSDPFKANRFDLKAHITFLRDHIDKEQVLQTVEASAAEVVLPASLEQLCGYWEPRDDIRRRTLDLQAVHDTDLTVSQVRREQAAFEHAGTLHASESAASDFVEPGELTKGKMAECVIKMCLETKKDEGFVNEHQAVSLTESVGEKDINAACHRLMSSRLITLEKSIGRRLPGCNFEYQERTDWRSEEERRRPRDQRGTDDEPFNLDIIAKTLDSEDSILERFATSVDAQERGVGPALIPEETVLLASMITSGEVETSLGTEQMAPLRDEFLINAKSLADCDNEYFVSAVPRAQLADIDEGENHTIAGVSTPETHQYLSRWLSWLRESNSEEVLSSAWEGFNSDENAIWSQISDRLRSAGADGVPLRSLRDDAAVRSNLNGSLSFSTVIKRLIAEPQHEQHIASRPPLAFIAGYDTPRLVSISFLQHWSVSTVDTDGVTTGRQGQSVWLPPRSWFSISGRPLQLRWRLGIRAVLSQVLTRPGLTRAWLCDLMSHVWDRIEVRELVQAAVDTGIIELRRCSKYGLGVAASEQNGDEDVESDDELRACGDEDVCLVPTGKKWYKVSL